MGRAGVRCLIPPSLPVSPCPPHARSLRPMSSSDAATLDTPVPKSSSESPRPAATVRGGFIVLRRARNGRLRAGYAPFEHGSLDDAETEAARLAAQHRCEFAVFQEVGGASPAVSPCPAATAPAAALTALAEEAA